MNVHDTDNRNTMALTRWASRMAQAARMQAEAYELLVSTVSEPLPTWLPASEIPLQERPARQALLLAAVKAKATALKSKSIPRTDWLALATHFGYDPRGTAGFFRRTADGSPGLLIMDPVKDTVSLADAGKRRIEEYKDRIKEHQDEIEASTRL